MRRRPSLQRLLGKRVRFLTGTDEHGEKIAAAAEKRGMTPQVRVRRHVQCLCVRVCVCVCVCVCVIWGCPGLHEHWSACLGR